MAEVAVADDGPAHEGGVEADESSMAAGQVAGLMSPAPENATGPTSLEASLAGADATHAVPDGQSPSPDRQLGEHPTDSDSNTNVSTCAGNEDDGCCNASHRSGDVGSIGDEVGRPSNVGSELCGGNGACSEATSASHAAHDHHDHDASVEPCCDANAVPHACEQQALPASPASSSRSSRSGSSCSDSSSGDSSSGDSSSSSSSGSRAASPEAARPPRPTFRKVNRSGNTIYVGNIDPQCTDELLFELGLQAGPVLNAAIAGNPNGDKLSFGFIEYKRATSTAFAIALLDGLRLFGRTLNVKAGARRGVATGESMPPLRAPIPPQPPGPAALERLRQPRRGLFSPPWPARGPDQRHPVWPGPGAPYFGSPHASYPAPPPPPPPPPAPSGEHTAPPHHAAAWSHTGPAAYPLPSSQPPLTRSIRSMPPLPAHATAQSDWPPTTNTRERYEYPPIPPRASSFADTQSSRSYWDRDHDAPSSKRVAYDTGIGPSGYSMPPPVHAPRWERPAYFDPPRARPVPYDHGYRRYSPPPNPSKYQDYEAAARRYASASHETKLQERSYYASEPWRPDRRPVVPPPPAGTSSTFAPPQPPPQRAWEPPSVRGFDNPVASIPPQGGQQYEWLQPDSNSTMAARGYSTGPVFGESPATSSTASSQRLSTWLRQGGR
ncbi:uncharacterized protein MONBRDRAFT_10322 [Monosiga brevicollis MX1]|uniref:RRM domain-containing protein n=1 Tax=Monosiga brevicollis TaxID=81824 RepID=A9V5W1_MONBE|nr:uncharacterized protein MONBRDRAFT_10322 [Monosiga brevicollis MX1]EDQ87182.1 predicted protein [Monosiga brevicollis MX1]|eukprot:XP_001748125.1 hypothetical protein [Monosiga brevicollis MX1]